MHLGSHSTLNIGNSCSLVVKWFFLNPTLYLSFDGLPIKYMGIANTTTYPLFWISVVIVLLSYT
jgi:hypothetical protein